MQERIVEIILYLVSELHTKKALTDIDVSSLTRDGYTQSEISSAFSWIFDRISAGHPVLARSEAKHSSHRHLNKAELMVITTAAYGYLLQCQQLELISGADIESIIEKIMLAGFTSVGLPEMKSFVAGFLFDLDNSGSQIALGSNDTIH